MVHKPHILLGDCRGRKQVERLKQLGWARMFVFANPTPFDGERWGFDNGAFDYWKKGLEFDGYSYCQRLDRAYKVGRPYIAIVPDIVAAGLQSLEFSLRWIQHLPNNWPWYFAVQDGMTEKDVAPIIGLFAGVFLGGSNKFKGTAWRWSEFAHNHNKPFHYGRAGTLTKLNRAVEAKADSLDSAFPLWTARRLELFAEHWTEGNPTPNLFC